MRLFDSHRLAMMLTAVVVLFASRAAASERRDQQHPDCLSAGRDKEVTVRLESKNQTPVLVQTWLDNGDE